MGRVHPVSTRADAEKGPRIDGQSVDVGIPLIKLLLLLLLLHLLPPHQSPDLAHERNIHNGDQNDTRRPCNSAPAPRRRQYTADR